MDVLVIALTPGMILAEDVFSNSGELIIGKGVKITQLQIEKLETFDIVSVKVLTHKTENRPDTVPIVAQKSDMQKVHEQTVMHFKEVFTSFKFGRQVGIEEISEIVNPVVDQVMNNSAIVRQLWQLEACDAYTFDHSVAVSLTSALLGRWLNCDVNTIKTIAVAGLMHDIGKVNIPDEILNKPGPLTDEEMKVMKTHATLGYVLLMNQKNVSVDVLQSVLQHHERYDGNGYPNRLKGEGISAMARIVAVADVFSAMTTRRVYREASNPFEVARHMHEESYGYLDPRITQIFLSRISNYYVGNVVRLSDGRVGEVVMIHRAIPHRPLVRTEDTFIDLSKDKNIEITELIY